MAAESAPVAYFLFYTVKRDGAEPERIRGPVVTAGQSLLDAAKRFVGATLSRERLMGTDAQLKEQVVKLKSFLACCADPDAKLGERALGVSVRGPSLELIFECHRADVFDRWEDLALYNYSEEVKKRAES
jgi:hypothetical protein